MVDLSLFATVHSRCARADYKHSHPLYVKWCVKALNSGLDERFIMTWYKYEPDSGESQRKSGIQNMIEGKMLRNELMWARSTLPTAASQPTFHRWGTNK